MIRLLTVAGVLFFGPMAKAAEPAARPMEWSVEGFAREALVIGPVGRKANVTPAGEAWATGCTLYPSKTRTPPRVAMIHRGDHKFPDFAPPLIVKFFQANIAR